MKELSIEEKAKAYDEAIERAKKWYNAPNIDKMPTYGNRVIEEIFPELKESEDEKIRKWLIEYFKKINDEVAYKDKNKIIAWLEKQKESGKTQVKLIHCEQKPAWSEEDEKMLNNIDITFFEEKSIPNVMYWKFMNWLKSLKDRIGGIKL